MKTQTYKRRSLSAAFLHAIDLSEQLSGALQRVQGIAHGIPARIYAFGFAICAITFGVATWYFDYAATIHHAQPILGRMLGSLPANWGITIGTIAFVISITPTIWELLSPRIASGSFIVSFLLFCFLAFDMATDAPRVIETLLLFPDVWGGFFGTIGYWVAFVALLLLSSLGFELVFCVTAVCSIYLFLRG